MNAIFDPSLLFISDQDWNDNEKRKSFIISLLNHLDTIVKYEICKIFWTDDLQVALFENPQKHPWFGSDLQNSLIPIIHQKFFSNQIIIDFNETVCDIIPTFNYIYDEYTNKLFLMLVHTLVDNNTNFYLAVSHSNALNNQNYKFSCQCNNELTPVLINQWHDWINYIDIADKFFPTSINSFDEKIFEAINLIKVKEFNNKPIIYQYNFSTQFKKDILKVRNYKYEILQTLTKKLILTANEARLDTQLQDEYIEQNQEYRIRVKTRPHSTRIHYQIKRNEIIFLRYYDEGQHDEGL